MSKINPCIADFDAAAFDILKKSLYVTYERKKIWNYFVFI